MIKKSALGRGLGALIDDSRYDAKEINNQVSGTGYELDMNVIEINPFQPRKQFDQDALDELASSIRELGIIQPITVRTINEGKYQLISGERRFRAAKIAGLTKIPAYIRDVDDQNLLEMALVENIQREDLNSIEIAISYQRLMEECKLTQEELSDRVGKKRSTITNYLRLLKLPAEIQLGLRDHKISFGHARALINIADAKKQVKLYFQIINEDLSVRKVEELSREINEDNAEKNETKSPSKNQLPEYLSSFKNNLTQRFGTKIDLKRSDNGSGKIVIPFTSDEELAKIMAILNEQNHQNIENNHQNY